MLIVSAFLTGLAWAAPYQEAPRSAPPPRNSTLLGLEKGFARLELPGIPLVLRAKYQMVDKTVSLQWWYPVEGEAWPMKREVKDVDYWPTDISWYSDTELLVCGRGMEGATIMERWEVDVPNFYPEPDVELLTGKTVYPIQPPPVSTYPVYRQTAPGRDMVACSFRQRGTPSSVLVQFWDSRDLYSFDTSTQAIQRLYASSPGATNEPVEPGLASNFDVFWSVDHAVHGYVYAFNPQGAFSNQLAFRDLDRDGVLDDSVFVDLDTWNQMGFADPTMWVE